MGLLAIGNYGREADAFLNINKSLYWRIGNNYYGREATAFLN